MPDKATVFEVSGEQGTPTTQPAKDIAQAPALPALNLGP